METTKFINKEMALMAATMTFKAVAMMGKYSNISGGYEVGQFTIDVHLEPDELFTLPTGYEYSEVEEKTYSSPMMNCPPFKVKKYYFYF